MVIGNGLIASAFERYKNNDDIIIFASGVSNSQETSELAFNREINLMKRYLNLDKKLIYFSTCSIFDESLDSDYIKHKLNMEHLIENNNKNYIIFRLPNIIGRTTNNNTFFNNIKNKIINDEIITIYLKSIRYLIDIGDVSAILPLIINYNKVRNQTINVCFDNKMYIIEIIEIMEEILSKKANKILIDKGHNYYVDNSEFNKFLSYVDLSMEDKNYNKKILKKYL